MPGLTDAQADRYSRHVLLREVGPRGQWRLLASCVRVDGAGPVGAVAVLYLAAAGVGRILVADEGMVEQADVTAGLAYSAADLGRPRLAALADAIAALNPDARVEAAGMSGADVRIYTTGAASADLYGSASGQIATVSTAPIRAVSPPAPAAAVWAGALLAVEAVKRLTGAGELLAGGLRYDAGTGVVTGYGDV